MSTVPHPTNHRLPNPDSNIRGDGQSATVAVDAAKHRGWAKVRIRSSTDSTASQSTMEMNRGPLIHPAKFMVGSRNGGLDIIVIGKES